MALPHAFIWKVLMRRLPALFLGETMTLNDDSVTEHFTLCVLYCSKRGQCVTGTTFKIIPNAINESKVSEPSPHHTPTSYGARPLCSVDTQGPGLREAILCSAFQITPMSTSHQKTKRQRRASHLWECFYELGRKYIHTAIPVSLSRSRSYGHSKLQGSLGNVV